jgi:hypothetical protein
VAAVPAMTPKPNTAATRATTRKIRDQLNITVPFLFFYGFNLSVLSRADTAPEMAARAAAFK